MKQYFITFLFSFACFVSHGQKGTEVGMNIGAAYYFGDLKPEFNLSKPGPAINLFGRYNFDERISVKLGAYYGRIKGSDVDSDNAFRRARNLDFFSDIWDATCQLEFNFFPYIHGSKRQYFTPYIFAGLSAFKYNPKTELDGEIHRLQEFGTEGQDIGEEYSLFNLGIAYGGGLKWDLNYYWSMNVELSGRFLFKDYLDDVSEVYPDQNTLAILRGPTAVALSDRSDPDSPIAQAGLQRGNSKNNDSYNFATLGIAYYFGRVKCPPISRPSQKKRKKSSKGF